MKMNFKKSTLVLPKKNKKNFDNEKDYPTIADLMREQNSSNLQTKTVHHRRDLDSLG